MKIITYFIFIYLLSFPVFGIQQLIVSDILNVALNNNLEIKIAKNKHKIAEARTNLAWSTIFPKIGLESSIIRQENYYSNQYNNGAAINSYYSVMGSFNQTLFSTEALTAIGSSKLRLDAANSLLEDTSAKIYYKVLTAYLSIIKLQKNLSILVDSKMQLKKILNQIKELRNNGLATEIDVLRTKSNLSRIDVSIVNIKNEIDIMYNNLELLINSPLKTRKLDFTIVEQLYSNDILPNTTSADIVLAKRKDYQYLLYTSKLLKANIDINKNKGLPILVAFGKAGFVSKESFDFKAAGLRNSLDWNMVVKLSWNFWDFGETSAKTEEARQNYLIKINELELLRKNIQNELTNNYLHIKASKAKISSLKKEELTNRKAFNLMRSRYYLGEVTNLELIDAQNKLSKTKSELINAKVDYVIEIVSWLYNTGKLTDYFNKGES